MPEYLSPGVYVEDIAGVPVIEAVSSSTGGFIGVAQRGKVGEPIFITSWNAFLTNFALGLDSPFMSNSYLAYSVYGFFQNGGKRCYVMRVAKNAVCATGKITVTEEVEGVETNVDKLILDAKDEGAWGNKLFVEIVANDEDSSLFDVVVKLGETAAKAEVVEVIDALSNDSTDEDHYWYNELNFRSQFISSTNATGVLQVTTSDIAFSGGSDGTTVDDSVFTKALTFGDSPLDKVDDMNMLCIPGEVSVHVTSALEAYCENRKYLFAILEGAKSRSVTGKSSIKYFRQSEIPACKNAALIYPWIKVVDPLSKSGRLKDCPACGHVMGVYARTIEERGVWKAPAGTEALVRGAIDVLTTVTTGDTDVLNPASVISIMPRPNYGIVIWGARSLHPDSSMRYVSDVLLDINIKKSIYLGTQQFVFEPNDHITWRKLRATVEAFLDNMWRDGALFGETAKEAYYVKCDEDLNPENVRNAGKLVCEVGYASKKPAEFVIFRFSHSVAKQ